MNNQILVFKEAKKNLKKDEYFSLQVDMIGV
jgi:hypothetical protein